MKGLESRKLAVETLIAVDVDKAYANLALNAAFKRKSLPERDRAFVTALVQGVMRHRDELDATIASVSSQPLNKIKPPVLNLLRVAVFQLQHMSDIPPSAVLNTAAEIGKTVGHQGIPKFITGVLRAHIRKSQGQDASGTNDDEGQSAGSDAASLSKRYSVPEWLVTRWLETRGPEQTEALLKYSQTVPPLSITVCESGVTVDAMSNLFASHGIKHHRGKLVGNCLIIEDRGKYKGPIAKLPGYTDGLFIVQDEAAAFASKVLAPRAGETVVDLCAAPGGKAINIADMMEGKGKVIAVDIHEGRLSMLKQTRQRLGLTNIETHVADGTSFDPGAQVDRVLIDAPCTGTGVINRRSDLRFKREAPDVEALTQLQRRLLVQAGKIVKPGGFIVYSTCSLEPEENESNILWFLSQFAEFQSVSMEEFAPEPQTELAEQLRRGYVQLLPFEHDLSGFFVAKIQKAL